MISLPSGRTDDGELTRPHPDPGDEGVVVRPFRPRRPYLRVDPAAPAPAAPVDAPAVVAGGSAAEGRPVAGELTGQVAPIRFTGQVAPIDRVGRAVTDRGPVERPVTEPARPRSVPTGRVVALSVLIVGLVALVGVVLYLPASTGPPDGDGDRRSVGPGAAVPPPVSATAPAAPSTTGPPAAAGPATGSSAAGTPTRTRPPVSTARPVTATFTMAPGGDGAFKGKLVITNTTSADRFWEVVLVFPDNVNQLRVSGGASVEVRNNQVVVRGEAGPGKSRHVNIGGRTSDGTRAAPPRCTVDGQPC